jgi:hypothetical protein
MITLTIFNAKYKNSTVETVPVITESIIQRILGTKSVTHYELSNNTVLVIPNYNHLSNVGFAHSYFKEKIVYNNGFIYHKFNNKYIDSYGYIRWIEDAGIKQKEWSRLQMIKHYTDKI